MKEAGAVAISDDGLPVMNARVMRRAMEFARSYDLPIIQHCEDLNLSAGGDMHEGAASVRWGLRGIPAAAEDVMVARDLVLAQLTGARYHVAHISTRNAVAMVEYARRRGLPVTCEVTPHHFALADADMRAYDSNYKMKPPLRSCGDREAVIGGPGGGNGRAPSPPTTRRTPAAKRCRNSSAARSASSAWRPRSGWRSNTWCIPARSP